MTANQVAWPMGMSDQDPSLGARPLAFNPQGFLVTIIQDADHAELAKAALRDEGFADGDLRVYTSQQILEDHERFLAQRTLARRVVGAVTDAPDTIELCFGYTRQAAPPCGCMSPRRPTPTSHPWLADDQVLHIRHYGHDTQQDLHIR